MLLAGEIGMKEETMITLVSGDKIYAIANKKKFLHPKKGKKWAERKERN